MIRSAMLLLACLVWLSLTSKGANSFSVDLRSRRLPAFVGSTPSSAFTNTRLYQSSFTADGSEYSSKDAGDDDTAMMEGDDYERYGYRDNNDEDETPTLELQPVPMSKNAGNRFVAFVWDRELDTEGRDELDLHYARIDHTEDHVMFCRKTNLYDDTFNTESMVDVLWSLPVLSVDLKRVVGHAMCIESTELEHVQNWLANEPILKSLTGGGDDAWTKIPLYRWRHIRDYSLRQDDGRFGYPCMLLAMDDTPNAVGSMRTDLWEENLEYLMRSERVIASGPLLTATKLKDDPNSVPEGDLILFNAMDRDEAIEFAEALPFAEEGLYKSMRVNFYNKLDITGKFVSEDPLRDAPGHQMKEAMEYWGYPVADDQTPWLNW